MDRESASACVRVLITPTMLKFGEIKSSNLVWPLLEQIDLESIDYVKHAYSCI